MELVKMDKNQSYRLQFIYSTRFMASSLSNLVNNLAERIRKIRFKYELDEKNVKLAKLNTKTVSITLNEQSLLYITQ